MADSRGLTTLFRRRALRVLVLVIVLAALLPGAIAWARMMASPAAGSVSLEVTCSPDTFRPDTWVVIECDSRLTNNGSQAIDAGSLNVASQGGPLPDYYWFSYVRNGNDQVIESADLSFDTTPLDPGQSFESELTALVRLSEGTWRGTDTLFIGEEEVARVPLMLVADSGATAPREDLLITTSLVNGEFDGELIPLPTAVYETVIENQSPAPIAWLTIRERFDNADLINVEPKPSAEFHRDGYNQLFWNLASFGVDSLAPGGSLVVRTEYGPIDSGCGSVTRGLLVDAERDGMVDSYGMRPAGGGALLGDCNFEEGMSGGRGGPVTFGSGGEGPAASTFDLIWAVTFLATGGASLLGVAMLLRRRVRR